MAAKQERKAETGNRKGKTNKQRATRGASFVRMANFLARIFDDEARLLRSMR